MLLLAPPRRHPTLAIYSKLTALELGRRSLQRRSLLTLAIETSCDDTSVAVLQKDALPCGTPTARLLFHDKITADNSKYFGIHPLKSLESHQAELPALVARALQSLPQSSDALDAATRGNNVAVAYPAPTPIFNGISVSTSASNGASLPTSTPNSSAAPTATIVHRRKPDFLTVTRGPGMRSSLSAGLDLAKGLALAWNIPLVGAHHMQAHALTPRLAGALKAGDAYYPSLASSQPMMQQKEEEEEEEEKPHAGPSPVFPFLSLLVSGGHTLLLHSRSLTRYDTLASTMDIALGDAVDKFSRALLPAERLAAAKDTSYGRELERYVFPPEKMPGYKYTPPRRRHDELARRVSPQYGWSLVPPLAETKNGAKSRAMEFSFSGLDTSVRRIVKAREQEGAMDEDERRELAREAMTLAFEHLATRVVMALQSSTSAAELSSNSNANPKADPDDPNQHTQQQTERPVDTLVLSGGVAANLYLRHILRCYLDARGFSHVKLEFPPLELCTDNAAMIAWAGVEMWEAGWHSDLGCLPEKKWPLDDGGLLGVGGWSQRR